MMEIIGYLFDSLMFESLPFIGIMIYIFISNRGTKRKGDRGAGQIDGDVSGNSGSHSIDFDGL